MPPSRGSRQFFDVGLASDMPIHARLKGLPVTFSIGRS